MKRFIRRGVSGASLVASRACAGREGSDGRALASSGASSLVNAIMGIAKVGLGVASLSPFACINGLYTLALVASRLCLLAGGLAQDLRKSTRWSLRASWLLLLSSVLYIAYSGWSFHHPSNMDVHRYVALLIATVTFAEIGINVFALAKTRGSHDVPIGVLRAVNLAASLASLVLTQSVLMAISDGGDHDQAWNGACGVFVGIIASVIALAQIRRSAKAHRAAAARKADG